MKSTYKSFQTNQKFRQLVFLWYLFLFYKKFISKHNKTNKLDMENKWNVKADLWNNSMLVNPIELFQFFYPINVTV